MNLCGEITAGFTPNCDFPLLPGVSDRLILMNKHDIDVITYDTINTQIIKNITLLSGKSAYVFQGQNRSNEPASRLVKGRYSNTFDHEVIFKVFGDGPSIKTQLNKFPNANLVAVIENNYRGSAGEAAFSVYGISGGLETQELENIKSDSDNDGSYHLLIRSSEFGREPLLPNSLFDTDYATTKAVVETLITAPIVLNISPLLGSTTGGDSYVVTGEKFVGITAVDWIDTLGAITSEPGFTVNSDTDLSSDFIAENFGL
ncbi:MAG: hypothetical protein ACC656_15775, partial [Candidatus Heimdallarchaeota archaeon]